MTTERWCAEYDRDGGIRLSCGNGELIANVNHTRTDVKRWLDLAADGSDWTKRYQAALDLIDGKRCPHDNGAYRNLDHVERTGYEYGTGGQCSWFIGPATDDHPQLRMRLSGARHRPDGLHRTNGYEMLGVELDLGTYISDPDVLRRLAAAALSAARTIERLTE